MATEFKSERVEFKDLDLPEIVYKYRNWTNNLFHQRTLLNREIFLSSPRRFNDPFDCRNTVAYYLLETDEAMRAKYFKEMVKRQFPSYNERETTQEIERIESAGFYRDFRRMRAYDKKFYEEFFDRWGVFSMIPDPLNTVMWAHYADNHHGICVGFYPRILFDNQDHFGGGGKVTYDKKFPIIKPDDDFSVQSLIQIYFKSNLWSYENEYRVDKLHGADTAIEYDGDALAEVYLGVNMSKNEKNEVFLAARDINRKVKVLEVFAEDYSYNLNFQKYTP